MSSSEVQAAVVLAPLAGKIAVDTAGASTGSFDLAAGGNLGPRAKEEYIAVMADGGDVYIHFTTGSGTVTVDETDEAGGSNNRAWKLIDGQPQHFRVGNCTRLNHKAPSGSPQVRAYLASTLNVNDETCVEGVAV